MRIADQVGIVLDGPVDRRLAADQGMHISTKFLADPATVKVIADNVLDYELANAGSLPPVHTLPCCRPPFIQTWVEWKLPADRYIERAGVLFIDGADSDSDVEWFRSRGMDGRVFMASIFQQTFNRERKSDADISNVFLSFGEGDGRCEKIAFTDTRCDDDKGFAQDVHSCISTALQTFAFMHCKNVIVEDERRDARLMKAQTKRLGRRPVQFKVLKVVPIERFRRGLASQSIGRNAALHIVRGHFKDYREKGLFGRHKDIFWWDQALAGTADRYVEKTYDVWPGEDGGK